MVIDERFINLEEIRCELERRFFPSFGMALDVAVMIEPLVSPQDGDPRLYAPPPELGDIYHPKLMDYQWNRLINLVRKPVQEVYTRQGFRALQIVGQTVLLFLPNGLLHAWVWDSTQERGMHLKRASHEAVAVSGQYFENGWLIRLAELATIEIRAHVCFDELRAYAYGAWTFEVFAKVLAQHADIEWMRKRIQHILALDPAIHDLAQQTISPLGMPGSVTVAQYNSVWRRFAVLKDVRRESPQLVWLYWALCTHSDFPQDGEPVQRLKKFLKVQGLTQRGWNMVLSLVASDLAPLYEAYDGDLQLAVLDYVLLLDAMGFHRGQPSWLVSAILRANGRLPNRNGGLRREFAEKGYLAHASHVVRLYFEGQDTPSENHEQELKLVLDWLVSLNHQLTRTQKQAGWCWLLRKAKEWDESAVLQAQAQYQHWPIPFRTQQAGPLELRAISTSHGLWLEGKSMRHCVGSYSARCTSGESLVFSVWMASKHIATAEYCRKDKGWSLHCALGPRNSALPTTIQFALRNAALKIGRLKPEVEFFNQPEVLCESIDLNGGKSHLSMKVSLTKDDVQDCRFKDALDELEKKT